MRGLYFALFGLGLVLFLAGISLPARSGVAMNHLLVKYPDDWELKIVSPDGKLAQMNMDEKQAKFWLLYSIKRDAGERSTSNDLVLSSLVLIALGFLGWRREIYLEAQHKKSEPPPAP